MLNDFLTKSKQQFESKKNQARDSFIEYKS